MPMRYTKSTEADHRPAPAGASVAATRAAYGLSRSTFARAMGASDTTLARWEAGREPPAAAQTRLEKVAALLHRLSRVMRREFIPTWLETPNDACKEAGVRAPLDWLQRGDDGPLEDAIFYLESGTPG
jgi:transcriptional regulator with XRE-family HTH domain